MPYSLNEFLHQVKHKWAPVSNPVIKEELHDLIVSYADAARLSGDMKHDASVQGAFVVEAMRQFVELRDRYPQEADGISGMLQGVCGLIHMTDSDLERLCDLGF